MLRSYRYALRPTRGQAATLETWLRLLRELHNGSLQERRDAWRKQRVRVSWFDQSAELAGVREVRPEFAGVPLAAMRGTIRRLDRAFQGFFRRCKLGEAPGFPRFKGANRYQSIHVDDIDTKRVICAGGKRVHVPMLGKVRFKQHRPLHGTPKAMRLTKDARGRWFVTFACADVPLPEPLPKNGTEVGIDVGLKTLVTTSAGEVFENARPFKTAQNALARTQRRVSKRKRGSKRRRKAVRLLAIAHEHVRNVRREQHIKVARSLVRDYDTIYVENLNVKGMARGMLAKSVADAGWSALLEWVACKAEEAGREFIQVNPRNTSQLCSECGATVAKDLSIRTHRCACGCVLDRDVNAARNIMARGRRVRREALGCETSTTREGTG